MKKALLSLIRRAVGTQQILEAIRGLKLSRGGFEADRIPVAAANPAAVTTASPAATTNSETSGLEILPGTAYSRFATPIEYPPSRDFNPRYGYSRPKIKGLDEWFERHVDKYAEFLQFMRSQQISHIPIRLADAAPLAPAWVGGPIAAFDTLALYSMVKKHSPRTYLEIGSGMTTCFARQAVTDAKLGTKIISIDPEPRREVDAICDRVIREGLEVCDVSLFDNLDRGDILFFDGSHRTFMNSDVTVFFIDVLPRIKPGVIVHIHDINLPWDYPDSFKHWYWNEQYMLAVYLMSAMDRIDPLLPTTFICKNEKLSGHFSSPIVDLGSSDINESWKGGGSMWFTKKTMF